MEKARYNSKPEPVLVQYQTNEKGIRFIGITVTANPRFVEDENFPYWEADENFFWEECGKIDLDEVISSPEAFLLYRERMAAKQEAQTMLDDLRNGYPVIPVIPVPTYREGAAVCNRAADQVKLIAGLAMGGLPYYELANGEIVELTEADIKTIAADITAAETAWQQGKQACWSAIKEATSEADIAAALEAFDAILEPYRKKEAQA